MGIANVDAAAQHWNSEGSDAVSVVKTPPPRRVRDTYLQSSELEFGDTYLISVESRSRHVTYFQQLDWLTKILS